MRGRSSRATLRWFVVLLAGACGPQDPADASTSEATQGTDGPAPTSSASGTVGGSGSTTVDGGTSTTGDSGGVVECGPPCGQPWVAHGDFHVDAGTAPADVACLVAVEGRLWIEDQADAAVLDALANLRVVDQELYISDNPGIADVDDLACLTRIGSLGVWRSAALVSLAGLSGLEVVDGEVLFGPNIHISDNPALTELPVFGPGFKGPGDVLLTGNEALPDLDALASWHASSDDDVFAFCRLEVQDGPSLADIAGAHAFLMNSTIEGCGLVLGGLPLVDELPPMDSLGSLGLLALRDMPALTSLDPVAQLDELGSVDLRRLPQIDTLAPLAEVDGLYGVGLVDLPKVSDLSPFASITELGSLELVDLPLVDSLAGLGSLELVSSMMLGGCLNTVDEVGLGPISSLAGLDSLATVGELGIAFNNALTSLDGAPLVSVDQLQVVSNAELTMDVFDAFVAGLQSPPFESCFGEYGADCPCFVHTD